MNQDQHEALDQPNYIIVMLENQPVKITLADMEEIRKALINYFEQPGVQVKEDILTELRTNTARMDPDGTLRISSWLLETHFDGLALTKGWQIDRLAYFDVAHLVRTSGGHWNITNLTVEREYTS